MKTNLKIINCNLYWDLLPEFLIMTLSPISGFDILEHLKWREKIRNVIKIDFIDNCRHITKLEIMFINEPLVNSFTDVLPLCFKTGFSYDIGIIAGVRCLPFLYKRTDKDPAGNVTRGL